MRAWRTAAYVAATVALVELLLLFALGGGMLVDAISERVQLAAREKVAAEVAPVRPAAKPVARKPAPPPAAARPRSRTVVLVLNGNGRTGAAASAAARVQGRGYRIGAVGNAPRTDFAKSLVMYRPGFAGEGHRLGKDLGVRMVGPLDGVRIGSMGKAHLVLIVGS